MTRKELLISRAFGEAELILLEDALRKYTHDNLSDHGQDVLDQLRSNIIMARRWSHQFGKSQREE